MTCPALPDYTDTPFIAAERPGVIAALCYGINTPTLPPAQDATEWKQRDINEMISRGWLKRSGRRAIDGGMQYALTPDGIAAAKQWCRRGKGR